MSKTEWVKNAAWLYTEALKELSDQERQLCYHEAGAEEARTVAIPRSREKVDAAWQHLVVAQAAEKVPESAAAGDEIPF